ncbi:hypothetical protein FKP32DRAFT_1586549 [Trametes sanguinea]|nr:hypothetical protein FKP32DRAFT_1586549 [Trametes sanguinea]
MFFLSPEEVEDYRREKRRRVIHEDREARLRALKAERDEEPVDPRADWGGSDEEPDEDQFQLMRRTASHVLSSPNPAQLEMRILANHGADPRFAFLRGRWSRAWRLTKTKARIDMDAAKGQDSKKKETTRVPATSVAAIGGLGEYGDSDEEEEGGIDPVSPTETRADQQADDVPTEESNALAGSDDILKAARRARAREWAEKRRAAKGVTDRQENVDS